MIKKRCTNCGDYTLDCDCDGQQDWISYDEVHPEPTQKCRIIRRQTLDAYYTGLDGVDAWTGTSMPKEERTLFWRALLEG